ncbi:sulfite exporter TauE/SafE family protein [Terasakiella sp. A23]|uniref:sulfite exporter TauE/SafE family protein n=1 Tax=Terasakiella sp. FCG-A23 TaxID=3080561 RepID=UPI0029533037|nr:sulfite exporter TauE/SafE family protein [Terasakiella sp. A23]MDV7340416.1 sulfite exporter TauE/SafE family protein [Terasakiella sp. A23]
MNIYLPIAEISVNIFLLLGMGGAVGFLSGMFGVGGGFLMTPLLIFIGVPPSVAVATEANQIVASSVSGVIAHTRRKNVDFKMGIMLLIGGVIGSTSGVWLFSALKASGQIDLVIKLSYVVFLSIIGGLMFFESARAIIRKRKGYVGTGGVHKRKDHSGWQHKLPFKMRFRRSKLYISALLPIGVGVVVGILAAIMGVGGGFIMVPAMIYLLGMPTSVVVGTSLFQIIFVTANVTILQAATNQTVDIVLALLLLIGGVIGAQFGARAGMKLQGEQLRVLLALMVLGVCVKLGIDLILAPDDLFSLGVGGGH